MIYRNLLHYLAIALLCFGCFTSEAQAADPKKGMALFSANCANCHSANMKTDGAGPALAGAAQRWKDAGSDIYSWIRNSPAMIASGDPYAVQLFAKWKTPMNAFPDLTNEDIDDILLYIENKATYGDYSKEAAEEKAAAGGGAVTGAAQQEESSGLGIALLIGGLLVGIGVLASYTHSLTRLAQERTGEPVDAPKSMLALVFNPTVVKLGIFAFVVIGGYMTVNSAIGLSRQTNYAPEQPIKFSHALHAGKHKIDCQYCHDGARRSKHSIIPATNTCMNCHSAVNKGPEYGTSEIIKIYAAASFNPSVAGGRTYFSENDSEEVRLAAYRDWLETMHEAELDNNETRKQTEKSIENQLNSIKSLMGKPVEWIRIHNLPDHVYFNHAQHVTAGGQECQTCHGNVEEMEVVKQYSPLSMGWCVNCHRQTEVKFGENNYYAPTDPSNAGYHSYELYHRQLKEGTRTGVTVEEIGGLECQKCHY